MRNFTYERIIDRQLKRSLTKKWQAENSNDILDINETVKYVDFHLVLDKKQCVGWIGTNCIEQIKSLDFVFINNNSRGKGYLSDIIRDAERTFRLNAILLGKMAGVNGYVSKYYDLGFKYEYRLVLFNGEVVADFCFNDPSVPLYPVGTGFLTNDDEVREVMGVGEHDGEEGIMLDPMKLIAFKLNKFKELGGVA